MDDAKHDNTEAREFKLERYKYILQQLNSLNENHQYGFSATEDTQIDELRTWASSFDQVESLAKEPCASPVHKACHV